MPGIRDSITLLGLDFKITDDDRLVVLEANGARSGINGYKQANGTDAQITANLEAALKPYGLPVNVIGLPLTDENSFNNFGFPSEQYARMLNAYISNRTFFRLNPFYYLPYGFPLKWVHASIRPRSWRRFFRRERPEPPASWGQAEAILFDRTILSVDTDGLQGVPYYNGHRPVFNEGSVMLANSPGIEALLHNKSSHPVLFHKILPFPLMLSAESIHSSQSIRKATGRRVQYDMRGKYVVVKPETEAHGYYVEIMRLEDLLNGKMPSWNEDLTKHSFEMDFIGQDYGGEVLRRKAGKFVIQEFVPGKPVVNPSTGKAHSATMRYLVLMVSSNGQIGTHLIGGYWRLAPFPLASHVSLNDKHIANLKAINPGRETRDAIPIPLSDADEVLVVENLIRALPEVYLRLLVYEPQTRIEPLYYRFMQNLQPMNQLVDTGLEAQI
ncbi:hypothetical protein HYV82_04370 [Candidatus Woesearchaeota archaeon]|nr:hypothetical protein [Candidatus Woesearchaeota archaeon]